MPLNPPAVGPPRWPRFGARRGDTSLSLGLAPAPVEIPLCWLSQPVRLRLEKPYTTAEVTNSGQSPAYATNATALATYGDQAFGATLDSACTADASNLASWTVTYRAEPLTRSPELVINLMHRTDPERALILSLRRNQRIKIVGVPPEFPAGADTPVISGITDEIGTMARRVRLTTRAVIGTAPGLAGPWFRVGTSRVDAGHIVPF